MGQAGLGLRRKVCARYDLKPFALPQTLRIAAGLRRAGRRIAGQRSSEAPPQTAEAQGSPHDSVSGQAHAGTCGQDRLTAAGPLRLVRPVLASVVPPKVAGQGSACTGCSGWQWSIMPDSFPDQPRQPAGTSVAGKATVRRPSRDFGGVIQVRPSLTPSMLSTATSVPRMQAPEHRPGTVKPVPVR